MAGKALNLALKMHSRAAVVSLLRLVTPSPANPAPAPTSRHPLSPVPKGLRSSISCLPQVQRKHCGGGNIDQTPQYFHCGDTSPPCPALPVPSPLYPTLPCPAPRTDTYSRYWDIQRNETNSLHHFPFWSHHYIAVILQRMAPIALVCRLQPCWFSLEFVLPQFRICAGCARTQLQAGRWQRDANAFLLSLCPAGSGLGHQVSALKSIARCGQQYPHQSTLISGGGGGIRWMFSFQGFLVFSIFSKCTDSFLG